MFGVREDSTVKSHMQIVVFNSSSEKSWCAETVTFVGCPPLLLVPIIGLSAFNVDTRRVPSQLGSSSHLLP